MRISALTVNCSSDVTVYNIKLPNLMIRLKSMQLLPVLTDINVTHIIYFIKLSMLVQ